jgi:type IV secretory pathway VirJ component
MLDGVGLSDDVARIAAAAQQYAAAGETVTAVLAAEPAGGDRVYLCAFEAGDGTQTWLVVDDDATPVTSRKLVRDATSIAALYEIALDSVDGGGASELRVASPAQLDALGAVAVPALQSALPAVEELAKDVEANYKLELT